MRLFLVIIAISFFTLAPPAHAGKSIIDVISALFEDEKPEQPDPSETLQAPFAYNPSRRVEEGQSLPVNAVPLNKPHRLSKEIGQWLMITASDVLTFEAGQTDTHMAEEAFFFAPGGHTQYKEFLQKNSMLQVLNSGRFHMKAIVSQEPLLLNEAAQGGVYRWLFEVPVIVSYIDAAGFNYKEKDPVSQHLKLTLQVRRVPQNVENMGDEDGVVIEIWKGSVESMDKG